VKILLATLMTGVAIAVGSASVLAEAIPHIQTAAEKVMLGQLGVPPAAKVSYIDKNGKSVTFEDFTRALDAGARFSATHERDDGIVTLKITGETPPSTARKSTALSLSEGAALPPLSSYTVSGRLVTNQAFIGHYTLVNLFFSSCSPCIAELPSLNAYRQTHSEVQTLAVTFDDTETASKFANKWKFRWDIVPNQKAFLGVIGVKVYPSLLLVAPDGSLLASTLSTDLSENDAPVTSAQIEAWVSTVVANSKKKPAKN
jgi:thiol-disulfide isomerase/thioredoxin